MNVLCMRPLKNLISMLAAGCYFPENEIAQSCCAHGTDKMAQTRCIMAMCCRGRKNVEIAGQFYYCCSSA